MVEVDDLQEGLKLAALGDLVLGHRLQDLKQRVRICLGPKTIFFGDVGAIEGIISN